VDGIRKSNHSVKRGFNRNCWVSSVFYRRENDMSKAKAVFKALFRPVVAILSGLITMGFVAGRFYERTHMMVSEDWIKIKR